MYGAYVHSPCVDETAHLAAGLSHWEFGRFDLYRVNPPLVRMIAALPVVAAGPKTDWSDYYDAPGARPEFGLGRTFADINGPRAFWLFTMARWACIPFSLIGALVCYRWACALAGPRSGIVALTLWCFCPNIVAHGQLITPDVGATSLAVCATYLFWKWLQAPDWARALSAGLVLGLALLSKINIVVLPLVWLVLRIGWRIRLGRAGSIEGCLQRSGDESPPAGKKTKSRHLRAQALDFTK